MNSATRTPTRGLATLALLKAHFDSGRDHLDMFLPFVLDVVQTRTKRDFAAQDIQWELRVQHGLDIPLHVLQTLLKRAGRRHGVLKREAGRYFRKSEDPQPSRITRRRQEVEREHAALAQSLRAFTSSKGIDLPTDDDALGLILEFLERHHVSVLLADSAQHLTQRALQPRSRLHLLVARFIHNTYKDEPTLAEYLQRVLEGFLLQSALQLSDISSAGRKFRDLTVFFDTRFLFRLIGVGPETEVRAAREALGMLRETNARLAVFGITIREMKGVLRLYERNMRSGQGMQDLPPTEEKTRFFLTKRYSSADVRQLSALLEHDVRQLGLTIREVPVHDKRYTLDEQALANSLLRNGQTDIDKRIRHDVDCVAGVLTLRRGRYADSLDDARAVFASPTGLVVRNVRQWYRTQEDTGVPPIVHQLALSTIAFLKNPQLGSKLKRCELVALCATALRPSEEVWDSFLTHLRRLEGAGHITSDEAIAVVASALTDELLSEAEIEEEGEPDAETLTEIVERVKQSYGAQAAKAVAIAEARAERSAEEKRRTELRVRYIEDRLDFVASGAAWCVSGCVALVIVVGSFFLLPGVFERFGKAQWVGWLSVPIVALFMVASLLRGFHVKQFRAALQRRLSSTLRRWFLKQE